MCQGKEKLGQGSHLIRYCGNQILLSMMLEGRKVKIQGALQRKDMKNLVAYKDFREFKNI